MGKKARNKARKAEGANSSSPPSPPLQARPDQSHCLPIDAFPLGTVRRKNFSTAPEEPPANLDDERYVLTLLDGDGCQLRRELLNYSGEMFPGPFLLYAQRTYEEHLMSIGPNDLPRCPKQRSEVYHNLNGMIRAWRKYPAEEISFVEAHRVSEESGPSYDERRSVDPNEIRPFMRESGAQPGPCKVVDVGDGSQRADVAVKVSFDIHVNNPNCLCIILGITHDRGYVKMLRNYLENHPDGGKVVLLLGWSTSPRYLAMPFQIVQWSPILRTKPLDPEHWDRLMETAPPIEKPRGDILQVLESTIDTLRSMNDGLHFRRPKACARGVNYLHSCMELKVFVTFRAGGVTSVLCSPDETFGEMLETARLNFLCNMGVVIPAEDKNHGVTRLTADGGVTYLDAKTTLAEYGVHWGSTVLIMYDKEADKIYKTWTSNTDDPVQQYISMAYHMGIMKPRDQRQFQSRQGKEERDFTATGEDDDDYE